MFSMTLIPPSKLHQQKRSVLVLEALYEIVASHVYNIDSRQVCLSDRAKSDGYGISLMERLVLRHPERVALLTTQYRSNELISAWSSDRFYGGLLKASPSVAKY